jgi:hypothetical protein
MKRYQSWFTAALALSLFSCTQDAAAPPLSKNALCGSSTVGAPVLRRLSAVELENSLLDIFPELEGTWEGVRLGPDPLSKRGFSNDSGALQVGDQTADELLQTAEDVAGLLTDPAKLAGLLPCAASDPSDACASQFISDYGRRLFRRPLSAEETAEHLALFSSVSLAAGFHGGLKWTLVSMIQAPQAIYRSEIGTPQGDRYALSQHEIATELAYTFGGTTPTKEMLDKADAGQFDSDEALIAEARDLLQTARGREAFHRFFGEWLGYGRIRGKAKESVPNFGPLAELMFEETRMFLDEIVYVQNGGVRDLLTAPFTFVNSELAQFYGYGDVAGDFERVDRPAEWGAGLFAQGSVLAGRAHMDSSSPTQRGLLVYERVLCTEVPPPPANIPPITPPEPGVTTTRARYENVHAANEGCNVCHKQFDPSGFAFEHFDETGRYRADEDGLTIDDSGYVMFDQGRTMPVKGLGELAETLASVPETTKCVSVLAATYAYGGAPGGECAITGVLEGLQAGEYGLLEYFARLAATEHTRFRAPR